MRWRELCEEVTHSARMEKLSSSIEAWYWLVPWSLATSRNTILRSHPPGLNAEKPLTALPRANIPSLEPQ